MQIQEQIERSLSEGLSVSRLDIVNESFMHNVPEGSESHFKVTVVSKDFEGVRKVKRHQQIYALLGDLMAGPIHALALHTYTADEWSALVSVPVSPDCLGGRASE
ncbi:BolA family protein [Luminiphilus syltensis NOR5-1B]|uniref:BolA family protein n=1 Tax=Luminiphilus syltensis NOR5-1B TaxID=565045 RepID=B8KR09_9GAMM|nr:BolA/IbaG family iron-sulfur metabolism protein [Luminiphilus syltensis]EED34570.1 BolA family protein [Luminiphilus syltensis NOR5-1B]